jgi:hypothetical protein
MWSMRLLAREREVPVEARPDLRAEGIADADGMGAGLDLEGYEFEGGFDDDIQDPRDGVRLVHEIEGGPAGAAQVDVLG